jgi:nucleoside-diphosphate-sugar epimerase
MGGQQAMQPVHIDDLVAAVCNWLSNAGASSQTINAVGPETATLRSLLGSYREQMGYAPARHISVPGILVRLAAKAGDHIPASPLCSDTLAMLLGGNTGDASAFAKLLGRAPRCYRQFIHG